MLQRKLYQITKRWRWWWWRRQWYDCTKVNWAAATYISPSERFVFSLKHLFHLHWTATWGYDMTKSAKIYRALENWRATWRTASEKMQRVLKSVPLSPVLVFMPILATGGIGDFVLELSMHLSVRVWSHTRSLYARYLTNHLGNSQKCNFS